jgi:GDP-4-dehydro-6-deoxy-D-mannose reductase
LAAQADVAKSIADPDTTWKANLVGSISLCEEVAQQAPDCQFILASSAEIYGLSFQSGTPLAEDAVLVPMNPYAASKAAADLMVGEMSLRHKLNGVRFRLFNHTGSGQSPNFAIPSFARQLARIGLGLQPRTMKVGAVDRWRDFLDVEDVCRAYVQAIKRRREIIPGRIYNIASGDPKNIGKSIEILSAMTNLNVEIESVPGLKRPTDIEKTVGNSSRAKAELDWEPQVSWTSTLQSVLADWKIRASSEAAA